LTRRLHQQVERVVGAYLMAVDEQAPGVVEGLYLTGSAALGDFRPGASDIDFVAVTADKPEHAVVGALGRVHRRLAARISRPFFDGQYVTWDELALNPRNAGLGPYSYRGRLYAAGRGDCDPVTWQTIAEHGVCCRGPEPAGLAIWTNAAALRSWTLNNFDTYWRPLLGRARRPGDVWSLTAFTSYGAAWMVLGVCRLHYTLATGKIASKESAGEYGLAAFHDRWRPVLNEALRIRRADRARADMASALTEMIYDLRLRKSDDGGSLVRTPIARRHEVLAFAEMVIDDAQRRWGAAESCEVRNQET
jgi:predicted nucleotidyltransferase